MAWHDNNWDGKVCCNPEGNTYCTGAHSLLSGRIEKKKNTEYEGRNGVKGEYIAQNFKPANVPPCYWSINAFSEQEFPVEHLHAFKWVTNVIPDIVRKHSVFTWPFKLSFVHDAKTKEKKYGNYWPDLDQRIENYINKFRPGESILFFYANYDNPVSADDMKYLLLGCSVISELPEPKHFKFDAAELEEIRKPKKKKKKEYGKWVEYTDITMTNFPTMNWMLQFSHNPNSSVLLPYKEYIRYIEANPDSEELLQDIKVIIEEESLIRGFKYVSMDIDDDKCLYMLYKIRKSIKKIQEHNQQVVKNDLKEEERRIDDMIVKCWTKRGIYPSLAKVLNHYIQDKDKTKELTANIQLLLSAKYDLSKLFSDVLEEKWPDELEGFEDELYDLSENRVFKKYSKSLAKLALFVLTEYQIEKIVENKALLKEIENNPYALYEEYVADEDDLDIPDMQDEPIDVYKVDMGMIPDKKHTKRHRTLQNLREDSPERVRSVIINYLWNIGASGHCYDSAQEVLKDLYEHPLIYKNNIELDDEALLNLDDDYKSHFIQKLHINETKEAKFFYLKVVKQSEDFLKNLVNTLINREKHKQKNIDIEKHIADSLEKLKKIIKTNEHKELFAKERRLLYKNIFEKSFFLLTGRPGAGKTYETSQIIEHLYNAGEDVLILTPTGKAALRISENIRKFTALEDVSAKTIDKYIFENKFVRIYDDWEGALNIPEEEKLNIDNLVIDESSMLDLNKLILLFSIIKFTDKYPKRIIFVGDENQLPPIGFGKPFHDIIENVQQNEELSVNHYINLVSNCRQENDEKILKLAEAFTDKTRCYEEAFNIIDSGEGQKSNGLFVQKWKNQQQLNEKVQEALNKVLEFEEVNESEDDCEKLNLLFGLYENGYVNQQDGEFISKLQLENFQILSPYRTGYFGTLGINKNIQSNYRYKDENGSENKYFYHADKIIRLYNWYWGKRENRRLELSNGSIGVVNIGNDYRKYFFKDRDKPFFSVDDEDNFDLAYAITVHKSQGSDFKNVFFVIPQKQSLLSKELLYTALTRSKFRLFIFVQDVKENLLLKAKNNSHLIHRNSSIFKDPINKKGIFSPEPGVIVSSKIEFIIYNALQKSGLKFKYEEPLDLEKLTYKIHPDFTIYLRDGKKLFWEHLGMLDTRKYYNDWKDRRKSYCEHGLEDVLITTDDLNGVKHEKITVLIEHIKEQNLIITSGNKFSNHHYELY
ncbi:MAG: AAA family ATPase [Bacteroidales bacterium]|nr:AAA family ATPase [Bacteroidales bacterium]